MLSGSTMGTTYNVKVLEALDEAELDRTITARLVEVNQLMSTYIGESEISQLNRLKVGESMLLSEENTQMIELSIQLKDESGGKFDPTLGPLIRLWGFGADPNRQDVPSEEDIAAALSRMGLNGLTIREGTVYKSRDIEVDFSAIAKGFGVDELARLVEDAGGKNYLVEIGGELRARGKNPQGIPWRIRVETPDPLRRQAFTAIPLRDLAMATSGDYRNYFEVDGKRFSHTLDPSTGYPITHNVASVTVLAESAAAADGYATVINVMGAEAGLSLAKRKNLLVLVILKGEDGFETLTSPAFDAYLAAQATDTSDENL